MIDLDDRLVHILIIFNLKILPFERCNNMKEKFASLWNR